MKNHAMGITPRNSPAATAVCDRYLNTAASTAASYALLREVTQGIELFLREAGEGLAIGGYEKVRHIFGNASKGFGFVVG